MFTLQKRKRIKQVYNKTKFTNKTIHTGIFEYIKILKEIQLKNKKVLRLNYSFKLFKEIYKIDEELALVYLDKFVLKGTIRWYTYGMMKHQLSKKFIRKLMNINKFKEDYSIWYYLFQNQNLSFNFLMDNIEYFNKYYLSQEVLINNRVLSESTKTKFLNYLKLIN